MTPKPQDLILLKFNELLKMLKNERDRLEIEIENLEPSNRECIKKKFRLSSIGIYLNSNDVGTLWFELSD